MTLPAYDTSGQALEAPLGGAVLGRLLGGAGTPDSQLEVDGGRWSVVAMNADGARRVVLEADVAAKVGWLLGVGSDCSWRACRSWRAGSS